MDRQHRKMARAAYKEKRVVAGVYAVLCTATGQVWVGRSTHVDTEQNGLWFSLRLGTSPHASLQNAWAEHGEAHFRFEQLDRLGPDVSAIDRTSELSKRAALWRNRLGASPI
ncbi:GIY-YIG nuclease family protein [Acetobacteraceae bacterium KSS8]|uniref:GIY-YIG nuclease family protein n=1 Tax=Endosaccharibacter trunci TaxID=2812733 RepID=A0ABT1WBY2_9PROT|nr:GIY-YIG nuclease family protein [Acetobacteraceae bacterium KSS8]